MNNRKKTFVLIILLLYVVIANCANQNDYLKNTLGIEKNVEETLSSNDEFDRIDVPRTSIAAIDYWTWVSGSNVRNQVGTYGTKDVAAANNVPGSRRESVSWIDSNGTFWLFGGDGYDTTTWGFLNDLWKFDGTDWTWVSGSNVRNQVGTYGTKGVAAASNVPGSRRESVSWIDSNGTLWLFGGLGYDTTTSLGYLNDLWKFDGTDWTWVSGSNVRNQVGTYGTKGVAAASNVPGSRTESVSWIDSNGTLWLFGGNGYDTTSLGYLNDLWKFDGTSWTWVSGSNAHGRVGTYGTKGVAAASNVPGSRIESISGIDSNGTLWLFGGYGYDATSYGYLNDLWKFDGTDWTWVSGSNVRNQVGTYGTKGVAAANNVPGSRFGSISGIDSNGTLWLFGGDVYDTTSVSYLNDLWKFDGTNWTWVSGSNAHGRVGTYGTKGVAAASNVPGSRIESISGIDSNGTLWLFGGNGYDTTGSGYLNDLWRFEGVAHALSVPFLSYPVGGETLNGIVTVQWHEAIDNWSHNVTYDLFYSPDSGNTWTSLVSDLTSTSYDWDTTVVADGTTYLIRVNASCSEGLWQVDTSDNPFTVYNLIPTTTTTSDTTTTTTKTTHKTISDTTTPTTTPEVSSFPHAFTILMFFVIPMIFIRKWKKT